MEAEVRYVEKPKSVQTSVTHSHWISVLRDAAKIYVRKGGGAGVSNNDFFAIAAAEKATRILKDVGLYEKLKKTISRRTARYRNML